MTFLVKTAKSCGHAFPSDVKIMHAVIYCQLQEKEVLQCTIT